MEDLAYNRNKSKLEPKRKLQTLPSLKIRKIYHFKQLGISFKSMMMKILKLLRKTVNCSPFMSTNKRTIKKEKKLKCPKTKPDKIKRFLFNRSSIQITK